MRRGALCTLTSPPCLPFPNVTPFVPLSTLGRSSAFGSLSVSFQFPFFIFIWFFFFIFLSLLMLSCWYRRLFFTSPTFSSFIGLLRFISSLSVSLSLSVSTSSSSSSSLPLPSPPYYTLIFPSPHALQLLYSSHILSIFLLLLFFLVSSSFSSRLPMPFCVFSYIFYLS